MLCPPVPPSPGWAGVVQVAISGSPTPAQHLAIDRALLAASIASDVWYSDQCATLWVPTLTTIDSAPTSLVIFVGPRASTDMLQADGGQDDGYTWWTPNGHAAIALLSTVSPVSFQSLTMHELMLSRHIPEQLDPGGLLGHMVPATNSYSPADVKLMLASRYKST